MDFTKPGTVVVDMTKYVHDMLDEFSVKFSPSEVAPTPALENLLVVQDSELLDKARKEEFHTFVAKGLFLCKRARPDIHPTIAVLCTRVQAPNQDDWKKLLRLMKYLNGTRGDKLTLSADDLSIVHWSVDASFAVHPDFKSHTGAGMTYGTGAIQTMSRKQKLNTRSSTEAELVGVDDAMTLILWTKLFLEAQGYPVKENVLLQDNKSTILLASNGKKSSSKRTRALNIRYFFVTDQVEKGNIIIRYCPTDHMLGDFMSKPLQGKKFAYFKDRILGNVPSLVPDQDSRSVLDVVGSKQEKGTSYMGLPQLHSSTNELWGEKKYPTLIGCSVAPSRNFYMGISQPIRPEKEFCSH